MKSRSRYKIHPNIRYIAWFNFLLDLRFYAPILIIYASGMSLFSITMLSAAIFELPTGVLSDLLTRKGTIVTGAIIATLSVLCYAIGGTYIVLLIGAVLEGLSRALFSGNNDALLHDTLAESSSQSSFAHYFGRTESLSQMAIAVVSVLGGIIATFSFKLVMYLCVFPALAGIIVATLITEPRISTPVSESNIYLHLGKALKLFWNNKRLRLLSLSSMIGFGQSEAGYQFRSAYFAALWPVWAIGIVKALGSAGASASFWFSGTLINKYGEYKVILIGKTYSLATNIISTIFPTVASPLIMSTNSLFYGSGSVASNTLRQQEYSQAQRATLASLNSLGGSLIYSVVGIILGLIADNRGPATGLLSLQFVALIPLLITWRLYKSSL